SGTVASDGTAARSAQAPPGANATTVVPTAGPVPSVAAATTVPVTSRPGTVPAAAGSPYAPVSERDSPRLTGYAATSTTARPAAGTGSGTSVTAIVRSSPIAVQARIATSSCGVPNVRGVGIPLEEGSIWWYRYLVETIEVAGSPEWDVFSVDCP